LIILFSPSEGKRSGGSGAPLNSASFTFAEAYAERMVPFAHYNDYLARATFAERSELFGLKDPEQVERFSAPLAGQPTMKAVERYEGVAYDYLRYDTLDAKAKDYVDEHTLIFSNLFGPIKAGDMIPEYKLKQGAKLPGFSIENYFKKHFTPILDDFLQGHDVIDLRAGFYEKFYTLSQPYLTFKFVKDGKVVSHWAKAYRGILLREMALNNIKSEAELMRHPIAGLNLIDMKQQKNKKEVLFEVETPERG